MHITPFEYWPNIGLFATFGVADAIRYRWLHILFPFYFATVAIGIAIFLQTRGKSQLSRLIIISVFLFFILCSIWKSIGLYSKEDLHKIFYYKGYNYDQFAPKFILGEFAPTDIKTAEFITQNYPEVNKGEAYRSLGTLIAARVVAGKESIFTIEESLERVPTPYIKDFIYGVVRLAHNVPEHKFKPLKLVLTPKYPNLFYENWGFQYLGHKYYALLVNKKVLFDNIPLVEQWFYRSFLNKFKQETADHNANSKTGALLEELKKIPELYLPDVVRGIGMRIGAEMLFDTLQTADYPLDSSFGEKFNAPLREIFYEGVGCGFAESMSRFWRMLLIPTNSLEAQINELLDIEWYRCQELMAQYPQDTALFIIRGFISELGKRPFPPFIKAYVNAKCINYKSF